MNTRLLPHNLEFTIADVGGHRLHITDMGEGSPTVVLEAGLSCTSLDWSHVLPAVAQFTRVCAYDRAGSGWSDPGPRPRTGQTLVNELHTLLDEAGVKGPLVLVGHSYGGLLVRLYASYYPDAMAGLVLVDAAHEDQRLYAFGQAWHTRLLDKIRWQSFRLNPLCARLGLLRFRHRPNGVIDPLPVEIQPMATAIGLGSRAYDWVWTEEPSILTTEAQVRALKPLPSIQAVVLAAGADLLNPVARQTWLMLQADLARKLPNSTYRVVEESGHFMHCDRPEVVIATIRTLVDEIRHPTPGA